MKKLLAVLLALTLVFGTSLTVLAADGDLPQASDAKEVEVTLPANVTAEFEAYQLIQAKYDPSGKGLVGYVWAPGVVDADGNALTGEVAYEVETQDGVEVAKIAALTDAMVTKNAAQKTNLTQKVADFVPDNLGTPENPATPLNAGTWMILAEATGEDAATVFNPMIVSVYYSVSGSDNSLDVSNVNASDNWTLETTDAYAKSSEITLTKDLQDPTLDTQVKPGDVVSFRITSKLPSYAGEYYTDPVFKITDEIINGLAYVLGEEGTPEEGLPVVTVKLGSTILTEGADEDYVLSYDSTVPSFAVTFTADFLKDSADAAIADRTVTVEYSAAVTDDAVKRIGENKATLDYTRKPGDDSGHKEDKEYVFTFALNGEFLKTGEGDDADHLPGATFTLYEAAAEDAEGAEVLLWAANDEKTVKKFGDAVSDADGLIKFKGLDGETEEATYYLKETAAPNGYSLNDTIYKIVIAFDKDTDFDPVTGKAAYTVTVSNNQDDVTETYTVEYSLRAEGESLEAVDEYGPAILNGTVTDIPNTRISKLPSTGGIGTTIFTVAGCLIMILAAGLFFASRRKTAK